MIHDPVASLEDMLDHAHRARQFVGEMTFTAFQADAKTQFAVLRALEIVGEAARRVPRDVCARYPEIPWRQIVAMRHILAHDYLGVRPRLVFETATVSIPDLLEKLPAVITDLRRRDF
jgi:uncharacterized protein with HEPN domain